MLRRGDTMTFVLRGLAYCILFALLGVAVAAMTGCSDDGGQDAEGQGTLQVLMTDATTDLYEAIYVTVQRVEVHRGGESGGWTVVGTPDKTCNLLALVNGVTEELGLTDIPAGHYTQLRMILGTVPDNRLNIKGQPHPHANYLIHKSGGVQALTVPSGLNTGIKVVGGFDVEAGGIVTLILDFDAARSVVQAGSSGKWLLKPTIKLLPASLCATIQGRVTSGGEALPDVLVSAQRMVLAGDGLEVEPRVSAGTLSGEGGGYLMSVAPGDYAVVAYKTGFAPACGRASVGAEEEAQLDFALEPVDTGRVGGAVILSGSGDEAPVTISFRASAACGGEESVIEVASLRLTHGASYNVQLAAGVYEMVCSAGEKTSRVVVVVEPGQSITQDVTL